MKLVDMRGLKPRPLMGPGSSPGTGKFLVYALFAKIVTVSIIFSWWLQLTFHGVIINLPDCLVYVLTIPVSSLVPQAHVVFLYLIMFILFVLIARGLALFF